MCVWSRPKRFSRSSGSSHRATTIWYIYNAAFEPQYSTFEPLPYTGGRCSGGGVVAVAVEVVIVVVVEVVEGYVHSPGFNNKNIHLTQLTSQGLVAGEK